jgi:uncharacterized protein (TIGR02996 family)
MNINEIFQKICETPENDELRLQYARLIEPSDPEHAELIRFQIEVAADRRQGSRYYGLETKERHLLEANRARWAHNIAKVSAHGQPEQIEFDRGFPAHIRMHPEMFVEYADVVFRLAPVQHIDFIKPYGEDGELLTDEDGNLVPFPLDRVLSCPQLSRLESVGFVNVKLELGFPDAPGDVAKIARCPHLTRCVYLNFAFTTVTEDDYLALAEGELTRKMLVVAPSEVGERRVHDLEVGQGEYVRTDFSDQWKAVERRLGYIPWLHPSHNGVNRYDARWHLEHGKLPKYPPGSPPRPEWYEIPREWKRPSW